MSVHGIPFSARRGQASGTETDAWERRCEFGLPGAQETPFGILYIAELDCTEEFPVGSGRRGEGHHPSGHAFDQALFDEVVYPSAVSEMSVALGRSLFNHGLQMLVGFLCQREVPGFQGPVRYLQQFVGRIIVEMELQGEPVLQSGGSSGAGPSSCLHIRPG